MDLCVVGLVDATVTDALIGSINALLPQTQCRRCGYDGCRPYAQAIAYGEAPINRCPPGGEAGVAALSALLGCLPLALDPACGTATPPQAAAIDEAQCIGCALCLKACPIDAIIGAAKYMHTVLTAECSGCELCLPVCPVDCIRLQPMPAPDVERQTSLRALWHKRHAARLERQAREQATRIKRRARAAPSTDTALENKKRTIAAAIERARVRRAQRME